MSVIKWRDSYNTGIKEFDDEHHRIVEFISSLFVALRDQSGKEVVVKISNELFEYTEYHFSHEEEAMRSAMYPQLQEHIEEHERLRQEVQKFQSIIISDFPQGTSELYRFLRSWLVEHIQNVDHRFVSYLKEQAGSE